MPTWAVNVTEEMDEVVRDMTEEHGATISNIVRIAMAEYLAKHGKPVESGVGQWGGRKKSKRDERKKPADS